MRTGPIDLLAEYLSGNEVAAASMGLAMPEGSMTRNRAERFFALRKAFGVTGYATEDEARAAIHASLAETPSVPFWERLEESDK